MSDFHPLSFPRLAGPVSGGGHLNKASAAAGHEFAPFAGICDIQFLMFRRIRPVSVPPDTGGNRPLEGGARAGGEAYVGLPKILIIWDIGTDFFVGD